MLYYVVYIQNSRFCCSPKCPSLWVHVVCVLISCQNKLPEYPSVFWGNTKQPTEPSWSFLCGRETSLNAWKHNVVADSKYKLSRTSPDSSPVPHQYSHSTSCFGLTRHHEVWDANDKRTNSTATNFHHLQLFWWNVLTWISVKQILLNSMVYQN